MIILLATVLFFCIIRIIRWRKHIAFKREIEHQRYLLENAWKNNFRMEVIGIGTINLPELDFFKLMMGNNQGEGDERSVATKLNQGKES